MKLLRLCVVFSMLTFIAQSAHANPLHAWLQGKDVDLRLFRDTIMKLENRDDWLNDLDGDGLTVLGTAILHGHQNIVELLLRLGFTDLGPRYRDMTLGQFAFRNRQMQVHVFLTYFEHDILNGYGVEEALAQAILQQREFTWREVYLRAALPPPLPAERILGPGGYLSASRLN